jgi:hypothetical protein
MTLQHRLFLMGVLVALGLATQLPNAEARFAGLGDVRSAPGGETDIQQKMAEIVGRQLSEAEQLGVDQVLLAAQEPAIVDASAPNNGSVLSKNLYCIGSSLSVGISVMISACLHGPSLKVYTAQVPVGIGVGLHAALIQPFWLTITYAADFSTDFDPVVGKYHLVSANISLLIGQVTFEGSSGNKKVTGRGLNLFALGYEVTPAGLLVIE